MKKAPEPPAGLKTVGAQFWRNWLHGHHWDDAALSALFSLCVDCDREAQNVAENGSLTALMKIQKSKHMWMKFLGVDLEPQPARR